MVRNLTIRLVLAVAVLLVLGGICSAQIAIRVGFAPPALPVYEQPVCPGENYIWTPGYWAWDADGGDYYWVPGTWVLAPQVGFFWTPPYWGWADGAYAFYPGYWGPQVGFYGGIVYGFGYFGSGFEGGRWEGGHFFYNRYVSNVNVSVVRNVYETRIDTRNANEVRVSFNGGNGGINARPTSQEEAFARERHVGPTSEQTQHMDAARGNPQFRATANHGKPPVAATARPGEFSGHGAVAAREGGNYTPPPNRGNVGHSGDGNGGGGRQPVHPNELPPMERPSAPNTGNAKTDQKYQQQQQKLYDKQNQERQKLQQQQEKEHQKFQQQQAKQAKQQQNEEQQRQTQQRQQQMEQRHQQQTQQMEQRHTQERQQMQQRQAPAPAQHEETPRH